MSSLIICVPLDKHLSNSFAHFNLFFVISLEIFLCALDINSCDIQFVNISSKHRNCLFTLSHPLMQDCKDLLIFIIFILSVLVLACICVYEPYAWHTQQNPKRVFDHLEL